MAGAFDGFLGAVLGGVSDRVMPVLEHSFRPWVANLTTEALKAWTPHLVAGIRCGVPVSPSNPAKCGAPAVRGCFCCGAMTCLHHAMVAQTSDVVCIKCVTDYMRLLRERGQEPQRPQAPWVESPFEEGKARAKTEGESRSRRQDSDEEEKARLREKHLRTLGLDEDADADEIKSAYRDAVKKWHPDRATTESDKARHTKKFLKIQAAWDYLSKKE